MSKSTKTTKITIVTDGCSALEIVKAAKFTDMEMVNKVVNKDNIYYDLAINQNNKKYGFNFLAIIDSFIKKPDESYEKGKYKVSFATDAKFEMKINRKDVTGKLISSVEEIQLGEFFVLYETLFINYIKTKMGLEDKQINTYIARNYKQKSINAEGFPVTKIIELEKPKIWVRLAAKATKGKPVDNATIGSKVIIKYADKKDEFSAIKFEVLQEKCPGLNNIMLNLRFDQVRISKEGDVYLNISHDPFSIMVVTPLKNENAERERENLAAYDQIAASKIGDKIAASSQEAEKTETPKMDILEQQLAEKMKLEEIEKNAALSQNDKEGINDANL